ncbi:MAG: C40 family peptidase [Shimia sp.]
MTVADPRLWPATDKVASAALRGKIEGLQFVHPKPMAVNVPTLDLRVTRGAPRLDRQLLYGWGVELIETRDADAFVRSTRDGYCGWVSRSGLGDTAPPTHRVTSATTLAFAEPSIKAPNPPRLSMGAHLQIVARTGALSETAKGAFVPTAHITPISQTGTDPASVARKLLGTPYLWGGNGSDGIDCSGLVQLALELCGIHFPGDSDLQRAEGPEVPISDLRRNDLVFWKGHVALATSPTTIIHANAHHMCVAEEPLEDALARISAEYGPPLKVSRPTRR